MSSLTAYNKQNDQPTLVGNWLEERALKDSTGFGRTGVGRYTDIICGYLEENFIEEHFIEEFQNTS